MDSTSSSLEDKTIAKDTKLDIQGAGTISNELTDNIIKAASSEQIKIMTKPEKHNEKDY